MQPVIELQGRIVQVRHVDRGDTVGYGAAWTAKRASRDSRSHRASAMATAIRAPRALGPNTPAAARAMIGGQLCPLVGRVSMDLMAVDVTATPEGVARSAARLVTLIGGEIDVDQVVAAWTGTIGYEVLTRLGRRYHRVWMT